jgi:hypothetical protein
MLPGPARADVERVNHTKITTYTVSNSSKPGKTIVKQQYSECLQAGDQ